ncbi:ACP S-malonyltransferase [Lactococcus lactis]|uniref:ACP S-malonyltransferase n=1 Tax=Lactococcus lactis TaxID=1358 RepID=UPI00117AD8DB|nr:ACP S-malonyltransferase [Lactococcus lactis]TRW68981.1 ACP S-malonyltransferase [Lactococcus lactis]
MINSVAVFPGQGSFSMEKFNSLIQNFGESREILSRASSLLGKNIEELISEGIGKSTYNSQIITFVSSYIYYTKFKKETDLEFYKFCGHSLGEITALVCAGVLTFEEGLQYVARRAAAMEKCARTSRGGMMAIFDIDPHQIEQIIGESDVVISNYNSKNQIIVSGKESDLNVLEEQLSGEGIYFKRLDVVGAFHSPLMLAASNSMHEIEIHYDASRMGAVYSSVLGRPYNEKDDLSDILANQITSPVLWTQVINQLKDSNITNVVEFGSRSVLANFFKVTYPQKFNTVVSCQEDFETAVKDLLERFYVNFLKKTIAIAVCSKNESDNVEDYEKYKKCYHKLVQQCNGYIDKPETVNEKVCIHFYRELFDVLLVLKKVPKDEIQYRKDSLEELYHIGGLGWDY